MPRVIDLTGQRFGRLLVIERASNKGRYHARWTCRCACGAQKVIGSRHLRDGTTVSCGCFSPTYRSWHSMMMRCNNPNATGFEYWGGRGIKVCEQWQTFAGFLADMGIRPAGCTLDRHPDPNGDYKPGNCRWAEFTAQTRNRPKSLAPVFTPEMINGLLGFGS